MKAKQDINIKKLIIFLKFNKYFWPFNYFDSRVFFSKKHLIFRPKVWYYLNCMTAGMCEVADTLGKVD